MRLLGGAIATSRVREHGYSRQGAAALPRLGVDCASAPRLTNAEVTPPTANGRPPTAPAGSSTQLLPPQHQHRAPFDLAQFDGMVEVEMAVGDRHEFEGAFVVDQVFHLAARVGAHGVEELVLYAAALVDDAHRLLATVRIGVAEALHESADGFAIALALPCVARDIAGNVAVDFQSEHIDGAGSQGVRDTAQMACRGFFAPQMTKGVNQVEREIERAFAECELACVAAQYRVGAARDCEHGRVDVESDAPTRHRPQEAPGPAHRLQDPPRLRDSPAFARTQHEVPLLRGIPRKPEVVIFCARVPVHAVTLGQMRTALALLLLALPGFGEEPVKVDPGRIPIDLVEVGSLKIRPRAGDAQLALKTWLEAHRLHKATRIPQALDKYLLFLGMPGHLALPARYARSARDRVELIHDPIRREFEASLKAYPTNRAKGLAVWRILAARWPELPEGMASKKLWHSDELRGAIDAARALKAAGTPKRAAPALERAIRSYTMGLFMYEARSLLVEVGGPDLRPKPTIDTEDDDDSGGSESEDKDEDDESEIEVGDG